MFFSILSSSSVLPFAVQSQSIPTSTHDIV
jgi:hypothetical protein